MKYFLSLIFVSVLFSTCTTDFQLEAEWKSIPIVYGFVSLQDTAHYIRVEKAFLQPGANAKDVAQIADSLYFENATVQIKNLETGHVFDLQKVDGNLEGYQRETGVFADSPNYLYKIKASEMNLQGGEDVEMIINTGDDENLITAETTILEEMERKANFPAIPLTLDNYDRTITIKWSNGAETKIFDFRWTIHYKESLPGTTEFVDKSVEWVIDDRIENSFDRTEGSIKVVAEDFYKFLAANIEEKSDVTRKNLRVEFNIAGGGVEFLDYLRISDANLGITSANQVPVYTNISDGFGIFASRSYVSEDGISLSAVSRDTLADGIYTKHLNF